MAPYDKNETSGRSRKMSDFDISNKIDAKQQNWTEEQLRRLIQDELRVNANSGSPIVPRHNHDGNNSQKVKQTDLIPGIRINGTIDMTQNAVYTLPIAGNLASVTFYGGAIGPAGTHAYISGNCQLGVGQQWQPGTGTSVTNNNVQENNIQGSAAIVTTTIPSSYIVNSQGHIAYVTDNTLSNILAMATITRYDNSTLYITVKLASGWSLHGFWLVN